MDGMGGWTVAAEAAEAAALQRAPTHFVVKVTDPGDATLGVPRTTGEWIELADIRDVEVY